MRSDFIGNYNTQVSAKPNLNIIILSLTVDVIPKAKHQGGVSQLYSISRTRFGVLSKSIDLNYLYFYFHFLTYIFSDLVIIKILCKSFLLAPMFSLMWPLEGEWESEDDQLSNHMSFFNKHDSTLFQVHHYAENNLACFMVHFYRAFLTGWHKVMLRKNPIKVAFYIRS